MSYRQLRGLYNTAALRGGVTMEDVAANVDQLEFDSMDDIAEVPPPPPPPEEESGGWDFTAAFNPGDLGILMADISTKYQIPTRIIERFAGNIYRYDSLLGQNEAERAYNLKQGVIQGNELRRKFWSYLRNKIHMGDSTPPKYTKAQRVARARQAQQERRRRQGYLAQAGTNWFGSNPYVNNRRVGNYRGLAWYRPGNHMRVANTYRGLTEPPVVMPLPPAPAAAAPAPPGAKRARSGDI